MTARVATGQGASGLLTRFFALMVLLLLCWPMASAARADERVQITATPEAGFGRLIIAFPDRLDLPPYKVKYDNGILAIEFETPITALLPDIALVIPDYATIARVDPDRRGIRIGLRTTFNINRMDAGEKLFIDLLPTSWSGLPPSLPQAVVDELAQRSKRAAELAAQQRKLEEAKALKPVATVRVGRNPTFFRVQFDWSTDTEAKFALKGEAGAVQFDWPVPIDLYALQADLPKELKGATNSVGADGSKVAFTVAEGVVPRFYALSPRQFVMDIDIAPEEGMKAALAAEDKARQARLEQELAAAAQEQNRAARLSLDGAGGPQAAVHGPVTPVVSTVGNTIRIAFPFEADTPAAAFRRGDTVWMVFDTDQQLLEPPSSEALQSIASGLEVMAAGGTRVVRLDLDTDRLATLGSEGRSWVLSLGDVLLNATEPLPLSRRRDEEGRFEMVADLERPGKVHVLRDPVAGDTLRVVTLMPPARGLARTLQYVDFDALGSAHGLVIKPRSEELDVRIEDKTALISSASGLALSAVETARALDAGNSPEFRESYVDLGIWRDSDPIRLEARQLELMGKAAASEGRLRDVARLELAQLYLGNQLSYEAIGVLGILQSELKSEDLRKKVRLLRAIADTLSGRPRDALATLTGGSYPEEADALFWRSIARSESGDFRGARLDAIAAEPVAENYPAWLRSRFLLSAVRAAVETRDTPLALRLVGKVEFAKLEPEEVASYQLMQGRIAELEGHTQQAIDSYGQVIAAEFRPTRAEAVYRTLLLLDRNGTIDLGKATDTLSAEALMWRGTPLEADMLKLLAELYFRHEDYREGFLTVKQAAASFPETPAITEVLAEAQRTFEQLYLNGAADKLADLDALSLYYDFRELTPPGARGDEMIRNLARRLVKVDLLAQAADLLEYQIDSRLEGVAKAQVAADLAVIRIANRDPEGALRMLNRTRLADLPPTLERQRRILEARALIDAGRQQLALDLVSRLDGRDAELLRIDGYWRSKNYGTAAELIEMLYAGGENAVPLTKGGRMDVLKAAVGFVLAGDRLGVSRLRAKFSAELSRSAEWPLFDYVTREVAVDSREFRKVAREIGGVDPLEAFLTAYREHYDGSGAMLPGRPTPLDA